ncbi:MAG: BlaI/MecI/CopY family transcriptional regulator [Bacteroidaceae bacterium]|nr:BlaI/MecI/CopY family transcriptional regulator [Bacteroidaceae bacterium]
MERLTNQEEDIMMKVWHKGPCFIKEVWEEMDEPRMPYTTLASVFKNLERKHYLTAKRRGGSYEYTPLVTADEYSSTTIGRLVSNFFGNSYQSMVSFFARREQLSEKELKEILEMMNKNR